MALRHAPRTQTGTLREAAFGVYASPSLLEQQDRAGSPVPPTLRNARQTPVATS
ncbi:hypothetical protein [Nostoc sp. CCY0012]|uniref:hypothetical protein n=1 Tax=Nostoc sp. CCY0012 TaxID=1056123 RepID=UPI0039C70BAA